MVQERLFQAAIIALGVLSVVLLSYVLFGL
jgi:hypothetical protein